ncbi:hypothetical protein KCU85_g4210, partial [Aureobasidium melanogenum]
MPAQGERTAHNQVPSGRIYCPFLGASRSSIWAFQPHEVATREPTRREQSESLMQEEALTGTIDADDDPSKRFEPPKEREARRCCMAQYEVMQQKRANHTCDQEPCFDEACSHDLPGGKGCRYSEAFHLHSTHACMWGWGKMLVEHAEWYGSSAAMTEELGKIAQLYRERHTHDKRFEGPVVVKDPPNASGETPYYLVVEPPEHNGERPRVTT